MFQNAYSEPVRTSDLVCLDPSLAQQSFKDDADINVMLERFKVTVVMPQGVIMPSYGDFTGVSDYRTAVDAIRKASLAFMELPANIRSKFENDPQKFLEFCADDKNRDEAIRLGLVPKPADPVEPPVQKVHVVATDAPKGVSGA